MLYIRAELRPSRIQGYGIFALDPIPKGTLVSRWTAGIDAEIESSKIAALPPRFAALLERFGWRMPNGNWRLTVDEAKYTNHSKHPNLAYVQDDAGDSMVAARDIEAGEELTEDYSTFDPDFAEYATSLREPTLEEPSQRGARWHRGRRDGAAGLTPASSQESYMGGYAQPLPRIRIVAAAALVRDRTDD